MARPDWWPKWLPAKCGNGHELRPGTVSQSWMQCGCAGAEYGGHHRQYCRAEGCHWYMDPPEHSGVGPGPA